MIINLFNRHLVFLACCLCLVIGSVARQPTKINPGETWPDQNAHHIQAQGGGIIKVGKTYYWYGESRFKDLDTNYPLVSWYSSTGLTNWKYRGNVLQQSVPENLGRKWVLERPKVLYNKTSKKYVMYFHLDDALYKFAGMGVAVSGLPYGPFIYKKCFRPLGLESRDMGQFIDDDGTPYLVFESRPSKGLYMASLSDDYLNVKEEVSFIKSLLDGGAIVRYEGLYYAIGSGLAGWSPNPNKYATATSLKSPWTEFKHIAPPETNTYNSQSTMLLKVEGSKSTTNIFMTDQWKPATQWDSRYL